MTETTLSECLLILIVSPKLEEEIVDWLLEKDDLAGFSSTAIDSHGSSAAEMNIAEQVTGRQRKIMFHVYGRNDHMPRLIDGLGRQFAHTGIQYWLMPLLASGQLL